MITNEQFVQWHKEYEHLKRYCGWIGDWDFFVRWRQHRPMQRKIVIPDFDGPHDHLYEDMLGWQYENKQEVKSSVSRVLFETYQRPRRDGSIRLLPEDDRKRVCGRTVQTLSRVDKIATANTTSATAQLSKNRMAQQSKNRTAQQSKNRIAQHYKISY